MPWQRKQLRSETVEHGLKTHMKSEDTQHTHVSIADLLASMFAATAQKHTTLHHLTLVTWRCFLK